MNGPIGLVLAPLALWRIRESRGVQTSLDLAGALLVSAGLFGVVFGLVRGNAHGWSSPGVVGSFVAGSVLLAIFSWWELRIEDPMLHLRLFNSRACAATNVTATPFSVGMFGSIFLLS